MVNETSSATLDVVVVIPTLNESQNIATCIKEVRAALTSLNFEVLVVDGHSNDGTDKIALENGAKVIQQHNRGYGDALRTGFLYVKRNLATKVIVMIDADLTYDPKDIQALVKPLLSGEADMVIGNRFLKMEKGAMTLTNKIGNKIISWVARTTLGLNIHDTQCGLRAFRSELIDAMSLIADGMPFAIEMLVDAHSAKAKIIEEPVAYRRRRGVSKLRPLSDGLRILSTIIRLFRDTRPLLFFSVIGAVLGALGLAFGIDITLEWFRTKTVERLPTLLLAVLLMISSMQLFTIGLLADMIKRLKNKGIVFAVEGT